MKEWKVKVVPEFRFIKAGEIVHKHTGADLGTLREKLDEYV